MSNEDSEKAAPEALSYGSQSFEGVSDNFSIKVIERAMSPFGLGDIPEPDGYAYVRADCGDSMEVFLRIRNQRIHTARFDTLGCGPTIACGSAAMELAEGRTVLEGLRIRAHHISDALDGLPESHYHCAELAAQTLNAALRDYLSRAKDPWKKLYEKR